MNGEPAILADGKVVTGANHGEAFGKLNEDEKNHSVQSGFYNHRKCKFTDEDHDIYLKQILMIRHVEYSDDKITETGLRQAKKITEILANLNLNGYETSCSPITRCIETAKIIFSDFKIDCNLVEQDKGESFGIFVKRVHFVLDYIPQKAILISHCDFIEIMAELNHISLHQIPYGSITYIENSLPVWTAKTL